MLKTLEAEAKTIVVERQAAGVAELQIKQKQLRKNLYTPPNSEFQNTCIRKDDVS